MTKKYLFSLLIILGLVGFTGVYTVFAQDATTPPADSSGTYTRKAEKASDILQLSSDKKAVWTSKAEGKEDMVLSGTWEESGGNLVVTIPAKEGGNDATVTFKVMQDELEVAATTPTGLLPAGTKFTKGKT
jgi:hypothetical protein